MKKQIILSFGIFIIIIFFTFIIIIYGKGYQIDFQRGKPEITGTGLLVVTSTPDGAQVFINDHLTTATNNTINLAPGTYKVKIFKDGYFSWTKTIVIQKEVVSKAEALLFPVYPKLENITENGVINPVIDPSGQKIAFNVASQSARQNGIYVLNINSGPLLTLQSAETQIVDDTIDFFSNSKISWSPDSQNIIATISAGLRSTTYLLNANGFNNPPQDITETISTIQNSWSKEKEDKALAQIANLKPDLKKIVDEDYNILAWSPDETKILYVASQSAKLPLIINPPLIGADSTPEERNIQKDAVYLYDIKEDKNFKLLDHIDNSNFIIENNDFSIKWLSDSKHLLYIHDKEIDIMDYDGINKTTIYAGPFVNNYVFPWSTGGKFIILTNLGNDNIPPNLYTVSLQ